MKNLFTLLALLCLSIGIYAQNVTVIDKEKLFDFYQTQRYGDAAQYLKGIYGEEVKDFKTLSQIGYCFLMAGNNVEAEKFYSKAYSLQPQSLPILFSLGSINNKRGNTEKAKKYYGEIVQIDSNNFSVYKLLANLYPLPTDSMKLVYLLKANRINPLEGDVAADLAEVHSTYQQYEKAYDVLNVAIKGDSDNLVLQRAKLPIANQLKKYGEAIVSGEKLLKDAADAGVIKDVAKAYYYTKKYQKAIDLFKLLEALAMENESTLYYTSLSYRALKNYPQAAIYTKKTIDEAISPNTSSYYSLLGLVYEENNQLTFANAAYKKGLQFKATPTLYYRLAVFYDSRLKQGKNALKYYNLYLKSKPSLTDDKEEIKFSKDRIAQLKVTH
ncbi:tetratricopeptide repeat protein [Pedobacter alluvionis]|uniref:Flp pilus assembly protein TadD n=1 Tax=Pedobacter alluvionis TaxID=475253 RepID=A0A497YBD7_9SPHI|nr:tetratricopeptide repeat protein [Pedobacter alluvionis]RLJ79786.1 Flp pilus assembly protein TadD [Pedobacter alluvionis]TFB31100.1 tetratricopeptide repeat protein [Pedobacter alluvionis]